MNKMIREVDEKRGIVQVTTVDERWYIKPTNNETTGLPDYKYVPSVTWVAGSYPKGIGFYKWLADKGWDEAEAIKNAAGTKGSKIHEAIDDISQGKEVRIDSSYLNRASGQLEELTLEECDAILAFVKWRNETQPITLLSEVTLFSDAYNTAGTTDYVYRLATDAPNTIHLLDFKTGQYVWPEYELQVSCYKRMLIENILNGNIVIDGVDPTLPITVTLEILQIGYRKNKAGYKLTEITDKFHLFLAAQQIWQEEHGGEKPRQIDYPVILSPGVKAEDVEFNTDPQGPETHAELETTDDQSEHNTETPTGEQKTRGRSRANGTA